MARYRFMKAREAKAKAREDAKARPREEAKQEAAGGGRHHGRGEGTGRARPAVEAAAPAAPPAAVTTGEGSAQLAPRTVQTDGWLSERGSVLLGLRDARGATVFADHQEESPEGSVRPRADSWRVPWEVRSAQAELRVRRSMREQDEQEARRAIAGLIDDGAEEMTRQELGTWGGRDGRLRLDAQVAMAFRERAGLEAWGREAPRQERLLDKWVGQMAANRPKEYAASARARGLAAYAFGPTSA